MQKDSIEERERTKERRDLFVTLLRGSGLRVMLNGPDGPSRHPGNASIRFVGLSAHDLLAALQPKIAASIGSACSSGIPEPSHVLRGIGLGTEEAESSIRFCVGRYTTDADIHEAARLIVKTASALSSAAA
jgi:cysteine desulfurase